MYRPEAINWFKEKWIKHQEDKSIKKLQLGGFTIFYKRPYELLHSYREIFENEIYKFRSGKPSPLIIDCGSNIGLSVLYFKKLFPEATIIAFEPDEGNFDLLKRNIEINSFKNIELNKAAVWIKNGEISFDAKQSEASHITEELSNNKVPCISLKDVLDQYSFIDFLKLDIEGAEKEVIPEIASKLRHVNNLFLEYHGKVDEIFQLSKLFEVLKQNNFKVYIRNAADNLHDPFVRKSTNTIYDVQLNLFCFR